MRIREMRAIDLHAACRIDPEWTIEAWSPYVDYDAVDGECYSARVLEHCGRIIGCMAYRWTSDLFHVHRLVISPMCQRRGNGRAMLAFLKAFLRPGRQQRILATVDEYDVDGQLFLRGCGFRCVRSEHGFLRMEFGLSEPEAFRPVNRIAKVRA